MSPTASRKPPQFRPVATDQCLFLGSTPPLQPPFNRECLVPGGEFLRVGKLNGAPFCRVASEFARLMLRQALIKIISVPYIVRPVDTS